MSLLSVHSLSQTSVESTKVIPRTNNSLKTTQKIQEHSKLLNQERAATPNKLLRDVTNLSSKISYNYNGLTLIFDSAWLNNVNAIWFWNEIGNLLKIASWNACSIQGNIFNRKIIENYYHIGVALHPSLLINYSNKLNRLNITLEDRDLSSLSRAVILGNKSKLLEALEQTSVNAVDQRGRTALQLAASLGHEEMIEILLESGADINLDTKLLSMPLLMAVKHDEVAAVELLVKKGAHVDQSNRFGRTALMYFAERGNSQMIQFLLNKKANPMAVNKYQQNPYTLAMIYRRGNYKAVKQQLAEKSPLSKELGLFFKHTKLFAHLFHLSGKSTFKNGEIEISIDREGIHEEYLFSKFLKYFKAFTVEFPEAFKKSRSDLLCSVMNILSDDRFSAKKLTERCLKKEPTFINTGTISHSVIVLIWGSYLILCNRGKYSRGSVQIFRYPSNLFETSNFISGLMNLNNLEAEEYEDYIFERFSNRCAKNRCLEHFLEDTLSLPPQKVGNCVLTSLEQAFFVLMALEAFNETSYLSLKKFNPKRMQEIVDHQKNIFENFSAFAKTNELEKYHAFIKEYPKYADPNFFSIHPKISECLYPTLKQRVIALASKSKALFR